MKKLFAALLVLVIILSMAACGENNDDQPENSDHSNVSVDNESKNGDNQGNSTSNTDDSYKALGEFKRFDDLDYEWDVYSNYLYFLDSVEGALYLRCDVPGNFAVRPSIYGFYLENKGYGTVIVSSGEYSPGITVDKAFDDVYKNNFIATLNDFERSKTWFDFTPDTSEHITINGRDTIKFAGMQKSDDYNTPYNYLVYGYCTVIENIPVFIVAAAGDPANDYQKSTWADDDMVTVKHFADELIENIRALDHYEPYGTADQ